MISDRVPDRVRDGPTDGGARRVARSSGPSVAPLLRRSNTSSSRAAAACKDPMATTPDFDLRLDGGCRHGDFEFGPVQVHDIGPRRQRGQRRGGSAAAGPRELPRPPRGLDIGDVPAAAAAFRVLDCDRNPGRPDDPARGLATGFECDCGCGAGSASSKTAAISAAASASARFLALIRNCDCPAAVHGRHRPPPSAGRSTCARSPRRFASAAVSSVAAASCGVALLYSLLTAARGDEAEPIPESTRPGRITLL
eukprot:SAG22_NODE_6432_length_856_cov_0.943197_1_plen_253_part_00